MKINFTQTFINLENKKQIEKSDLDKTPITLADVSVNALLSFTESERSIDGNEKFSRYQLATKIKGTGEIDLKPEEITKIKELIGKIYPPLIVGQAWEMLNK